MPYMTRTNLDSWFNSTVLLPKGVVAVSILIYSCGRFKKDWCCCAIFLVFTYVEICRLLAGVRFQT